MLVVTLQRPLWATLCSSDLCGQQYQVHGSGRRGLQPAVPATSTVNINTRFVFLSGGSCPVVEGQ